MFELDLSDTQRDLVGAIRSVCAGYDDDYWSRHDQEHLFPDDFFDAMVKVGVVGMMAEPEYGGGGSTVEDAALALQEIAASGAGINGCSTVHLSMFGFHPVTKWGSPELREKYLPRISSGEIHVSFSVTEPDAGSDTTRITTKAVPTDDGWLLRGRKVWMTKGLQSSAALVLARTKAIGETARPVDGLSLFVADLDPSYVDIKAISKMGRNAVASCEVVFDDLPIPRENLVGEEGRGFYNLLDGLNPERILVAAEAVGLGIAALRRGTDYARERVVFGRPIGQNQGIAHPLADAYMQLQAAANMVRVAARLYDSGKPCGTEANTAKFLAARAAFFAADRALQNHGGMGYATEYHVERYFREARMLRITPVTEEQIFNYVAERALKLPKSY
ncbi:acyl-CoA dehydrogenase family protein [Pseudonocardia sp. NPDC049154]|uniref:acyl-CoA dehydrogenase family protein n=1 Tax=Pseudonocardia sp. NPDC049154 TaxID=3155501 RepID=UPI0033ED8BFC